MKARQWSGISLRSKMPMVLASRSASFSSKSFFLVNLSGIEARKSATARSSIA